MKSFDVLVIGGGPGGYVAAIRASQLGNKVGLVEMSKLGGVCLNKGCIPTKAVLKSAHAVHELADFKALGIDVELKGTNGTTAVKRAKGISDRISKGVGFLMKKNNIEVIEGYAKLKSATTVEVKSAKGHTDTVNAKKIIIATGAHYRTFPGLEHDNERLIGAWEAIHMEEMPKSIGIIGAGAIGVEFAYFWNAFGVDVHILNFKNICFLLKMKTQKKLKKLIRNMALKCLSVLKNQCRTRVITSNFRSKKMAKRKLTHLKKV